MDDSYQVYVNRVASLTLRHNQASQLTNIHTSQKFNHGQPTTFRGCTIMTLPGEEDSQNQEFYQILSSYQQELLQHLAPGVLVPLPQDSFHCTVADLIWEENYEDAIAQNPDFDLQLAQSVGSSFTNYQQEHGHHRTVKFELIGLSFFPRSLVACLVPASEEDYQRVIDLRRHIYQNENVLALGIERQRNNFTAHITLGYFGEEASNIDSDNFLDAIAKINERQADEQHPCFNLEKIELRKFENMVSFNSLDQGPIVKL